MNKKILWKERVKESVLPDLLLCGFLALFLEIILEICDWRSVSLFGLANTRQ